MRFPESGGRDSLLCTGRRLSQYLTDEQDHIDRRLSQYDDGEQGFQHSYSDQFSAHEGVAESEDPEGADVVGKASRVRASSYSRQREARD